MATAWNILVVDDEPDIHMVTRLALKHRNWDDRGFELTQAKSRAEAEELLQRKGPAAFDAALIDVVMETDDAGLKLCQTIRASCPPSLRIILRTGQPGAAPEARVMNDYDIDLYLPKSDLTEEKLYSALRTALRASQEVATVLAAQTQLEGFAQALQDTATLDEIKVIMAATLDFLEVKYLATAVLIYDLEDADAYLTGRSTKSPKLDLESVRKDIRAAHTARKASGSTVQVHVVSNDRVVIGFQTGGRSPNAALKQLGFFKRLKANWGKHPARAQSQPLVGGLLLDFAGKRQHNARLLANLAYDSRLFLGNWCLAQNTLLLQENIAQARVRRAYALDGVT